MSTLPTGTVTFLFTDIEGSTTRWEQHHELMQHALARHDAIVRATITVHGGHIFKTVGDAFCAAFTRAPDALIAAVDAQQMLAAEPWPTDCVICARIAIHSGIADERDGDYFGQTLNRVARLLAAGHGGQILLSLATHELVRDHLPSSADLRDLGEHRLKDLIRPERIFQLVAPELPTDFPPLRTLDNRPNNLPLQLTPFIGRVRELEIVERRLAQPDVRLLTLLGPGGTGKTRLALQAAADVLDRFPDGVWFVTLAPISDPALVTSTIAATLGIVEGGSQPLLGRLMWFLRDKHVLLVLDNFEHILPAAPVVTDLLVAAPGLQVLVTSRALLGLYGEHDVAVPPLQLPDLHRLPPLKQLSQYEAVRLFIERAQAAKADFAITNANAPAVAEICVRLDGLPLAIELAAARVRLLPSQALLARLSSRLQLLNGGRRDLPTRQQTLRGTITWSYELLDAEEQQLFARLAVFVGGRTLDAIEAVCNAAGDLAGDVLDGVASLVDKSLLQQTEGPDGEPRFVMLETIHEYAWERLVAGGEADVLQQRHAAYFLNLAEQARAEREGAQAAAWFDRLEAEHDNLRAALAWALERQVGETALRLAEAMSEFWWNRGYVSEGQRWLEAVVALGDSLAERQPPMDPALLAKALRSSAWFVAQQGDVAGARTRGERALALTRASGGVGDVALALAVMASITNAMGEVATGRRLHAEALELYRSLGERYWTAIVLNNMGYQEFLAGNAGRAQELLAESVRLGRQLENTDILSTALSSLGQTLVERGAYAEAQAVLTEGLQISRHLGAKVDMLNDIEAFACLAARHAVEDGQTAATARRTARLFGAAGAWRKAMGGVLSESERALYGRHMAAARAHLDDPEWDVAWAEGQAMTLEQAVAYALER